MQGRILLRLTSTENVSLVVLYWKWKMEDAQMHETLNCNGANTLACVSSQFSMALGLIRALRSPNIGN